MSQTIAPEGPGGGAGGGREVGGGAAGPGGEVVRRRWQAVVAVVAALTALPILLVVASLLTPSAETWRVLLDSGLVSQVVTTIALVVVVVLGTTVLGGGLAWVVGRYAFPGQRLFSWLLVLPLAMPAYVSGFVYIGLLDHPGPVQSGLRALLGEDVWFPEVRSFWLCAVVLVLAFYPYTYVLARAALREQSATAYEAARALGAGPASAARRVILPLARPTLAAGAMIVAMETLTDFATVQYFGVSTVSVGIHQVWVGMYDREAASELAGVVMLFAVAVIVAERLARGGARFHQQSAGRPLTQVRLRGRSAALATGGCSLALGITFVVPLLQLLAWSRPSETTVALDGRFLGYLASSASVALIVAVLCTLVGLVLASASRLAGGRGSTWLARVATLGYAVPGPVVAIGVLIMLSAVDAAVASVGISLGTSLVTGTLAGLVYAYVVRFLALAWSTLDAGLEKVSPSLTMAALSLGARPTRVISRVHLPMLRPGIGVALVLVGVDTLKELPIMLLLRPFGFETLAVWVNQLATESRWESAGPPALTIVAIAVIPIVLVFRRTLTPPQEET